MSMDTTIGREYNLLHPTPESARQIKLKSPILLNDELDKLRQIEGTTRGRYKSITLPILYNPKEGAVGLERELHALCRQASTGIATGTEYIILSDRAIDKNHAPIPALLAVACVHHHLIREGTRTQVSIVLESGEPREVHHYALLIGYGAGAVNPYLAFETIEDMIRQGHIASAPLAERNGHGPDGKKAIKNYVKAINKGVLKVMSKMGISTAQSYCGRRYSRRSAWARTSSTPISPARPRASAASASMSSPARHAPATTRRSPSAPPTATRSTSAAIINIAAKGNITSSIPRRFTSCNTPAAPGITRYSRNTRAWSTTARNASAPCAG